MQVPKLIKAVSDLRAEIAGLSSKQCDNQFSPHDMFSEIEERNNRAANLIVHNMEESKSSDLLVKQQHDGQEAGKLIGVHYNNYHKIIRLGKPLKDKPRPIKAVTQTFVTNGPLNPSRST